MTGVLLLWTVPCGGGSCGGVGRELMMVECGGSSWLVVVVGG